MEAALIAEVAVCRPLRVGADRLLGVGLAHIAASKRRCMPCRRCRPSEYYEFQGQVVAGLRLRSPKQISKAMNDGGRVSNYSNGGSALSASRDMHMQDAARPFSRMNRARTAKLLVSRESKRRLQVQSMRNASQQDRGIDHSLAREMRKLHVSLVGQHKQPAQSRARLTGIHSVCRYHPSLTLKPSVHHASCIGQPCRCWTSCSIPSFAIYHFFPGPPLLLLRGAVETKVQ